MNPAEPPFTLADLRVWSPANPVRLAVLGDPVAHSLSPAMQNAALEFHKIPARYGRFQIQPADLAEALLLLRQHDFLGANLTLPHKHAALPFLAAVDPNAANFGAVNTLQPAASGWHGWNTDGAGLARAITEEFGTKLGELRVLILGAGGGAGRAIACQSVIEGSPSVLLANRTDAKAENLALELGENARAVPWKTLAEAVAEVDLVINATSCGMQESDAQLLPPSAFRRDQFLYDTIYRPEHTRLLRDAKSAGARAANGLSMLLHQGALAFEIWFNRPAPLEVMRRALGHAADSPAQS